MDALAALRLQVEWGADEALDEVAPDRRSLPVPISPPPPVRQLAPSKPPAIAASTPDLSGIQSLAALNEALATFDGSGLRKTATNLVLAEGDPNARFVLIGDVPGPDEDRTGRPFSGAAGEYLDRMLASIGLDRTQAMLTPLLPWRPPGDRPPSEAELKAGLPFLHRQLALVNPAFAVLFGRTAYRALTGGDVRRSRGKWTDVTVPGRELPLPVLALPTIAHIRSTGSARRDTWADLILLRLAITRLRTTPT
jgi:uracil-DNA glycosylase family 4